MFKGLCRCAPRVDWKRAITPFPFEEKPLNSDRQTQTKSRRAREITHRIYHSYGEMVNKHICDERKKMENMPWKTPFNLHHHEHIPFFPFNCNCLLFLQCITMHMHMHTRSGTWFILSSQVYFCPSIWNELFSWLCAHAHWMPKIHVYFVVVCRLKMTQDTTSGHMNAMDDWASLVADAHANSQEKRKKMYTERAKKKQTRQCSIFV